MLGTRKGHFGFITFFFSPPGHPLSPILHHGLNFESRCSKKVWRPLSSTRWNSILTTSRKRVWFSIFCHTQDFFFKFVHQSCSTPLSFSVTGPIVVDLVALTGHQLLPFPTRCDLPGKKGIGDLVWAHPKPKAPSTGFRRHPGMDPD